MSKTSTVNDTSLAETHNFIPKELHVVKDTNGVPRTVHTHLTKLQTLLSDWTRLTEKGNKITKSIASLKLHECEDGYHPSALKPLAEALVDILDSMEHIVEGVDTIDKQLQALAKLASTNEPVILTWPAAQISDNVSRINGDLKKEYQLKQAIVENIAHCRDENVTEVYVSAWEFEVYLDLQSNTSYLFAEVGLPGIT